MSLSHNCEDRMRICTPIYGWTHVKPFPKSDLSFPASWLTNPAKDMTYALIAYQYTGEKQSFELDNEGEGLVTIVYENDRVYAYDTTMNLIHEEALSNRDIDVMLTEIAHDVGLDHELWRDAWDSDEDV